MLLVSKKNVVFSKGAVPLLDFWRDLRLRICASDFWGILFGLILIEPHTHWGSPDDKIISNTEYVREIYAVITLILFLFP